MSTLPFQLDLSRPVLLVGTGDAAVAKRRLLESLHARIDHWSEAPSSAVLHAATRANEIESTRYALVVVAELTTWTESIRRWARHERLLINVVDTPDQSDGFIPAIVSRGAVQIGIGTGGASPVLARLIRTRIEQALPTHLNHFAALAARWQSRIRQALPEVSVRRRFWERLLTDPILDQPAFPSDPVVDGWVGDLIQNAVTGLGRVSLVGCGPGEAGLLTLTGLKRLQEADVVLYDQLVDPSILALARRDADLEDVGKRRGQCPVPQTAICERLVALAQRGLTVCRLKGGDPLIFGRGSEEAIALRTAGIPVDIVPGITSASAIAAAQGIPLTHRGLARSVRFVTGHLAVTQPSTDWAGVVAKTETLVIYMGYSHAETIARELIAAGADRDLPVAFVQNGARSSARLWESTLEAVTRSAPVIDLRAGPVLIIIGRVVALRRAMQASSAAAGDNALYWLKSAS